MSSDVKEKVQEFGLTEVFRPPQPLVDVIFVHGLNGHPYNTWATHEPEVFWPTDLLPEVVEDQRCRLLTYGYDANVTSFTDGTSKDHIQNHAEHLAARLVANRSLKARERPIIFVAHSLGGLVVKRLLIYCESINNPKLERLRSIYVSTFGILFLGTPHNGSDLAKWGSLLQSICGAVLPKKWLDTSPQLVNALKNNNEILQNINRLFVEIMEPLRIYFFHEAKPMDLKTTKHFVVDEDSAAPIIPGVERMGIEKDHSNMCKFEDASAPGFDVVSDAIASYADEAPSKIKTRWEHEKRQREYYRQSIANEILGDSAADVAQAENIHPPSTASVALVDSGSVENFNTTFEQAGKSPPHNVAKQPRVAPLLFRPNSIFVGFEIELGQLQLKLSNERRNAIGTCSVLVCGPPGSGKSHLAREYVWNHQADYPAGIFWVDCKSRHTRDRYYWDIGQALGCLSNYDSGSFQDDRSFIDEVRRCLESRQGWLIVFDNIFFDTEEALSDFVPYIPDSSGNSIIFTSIDQTLKGRHRLLNPSWVRLRPLSPRAACQLLFKSLNMREYNSTQLRKAQELVRYYAYLPLGIHAAAHMLVAQGRALEKFSPASSDKRLTNPFLEIIRALENRTYDEAINLLVLLSFLGHKVPVVLLQFGNTSLLESERPIASLDNIGGIKADLDNTISTLLRYGLVERELQTYSVSVQGQARSSPINSRRDTTLTIANSSSSIRQTMDDSSDIPISLESSGSDSSISVMIDTLRTHPIVQRIVRDEIRTRTVQHTSYDEWLLIACRFITQSYRTAATKLGALPGPGSVADYREYKLHITTIWKLLPRLRKQMPASIVSVRHDIKHIFREIQNEIHNRSPSQSRSSKVDPPRYVGSIFETSASSSEEGLLTPQSGLSRESTWNSDDAKMQSESPVVYGNVLSASLDDPLSDLDEDGYASDLEDLMTAEQFSKRERQGTTVHRRPSQSPAGSPRQSILQVLLQGAPGSSKRRDSDDYKTLPTLGKIINSNVESNLTRSSSASSGLQGTFRTSSNNISAENALTTIQIKSLGTASRPFGSRHVSSGSESKENRRPVSTQPPLEELSSNSQPRLQTSSDLQLPVTIPPKSRENSNERSRRPSTSPRLVNAVLSRQAEKARVGLPIEQASVTAPMTGRFQQSTSLPRWPAGFPSASRSSDYTSVSMSRDASSESAYSAPSVPTGPERAISSLDVGSRLLNGPKALALPSIDIAMARETNVGPHLEWIWKGEASYDDTTGFQNSSLSRPVTRDEPASVPLSPELRLQPIDTSERQDLSLSLPDLKEIEN